MASPLQPGDHYILRKLCNELLPWMVSGKAVGRQYFVRLAALYGYVGDFAAALAGLGIGAPLSAVVQGKAADGRSALDVLHTVLPAGWTWAGGVALVAWAALRLVIQRQDVMARALLAAEYTKTIDGLYAELYQALTLPDPMDAIKTIQKSVNDRLQDAIRNNIWPWTPPMPPPDDLQPMLSDQIRAIRETYMDKWNLPPPGDA